MGPVSTPDLAVAVAEAGGVGTIACMGMSAAQLDAVVTAMAARTDGALAANFLTDAVDRDAVEVAAYRLALVDFFWADPDSGLVQLVHDAGSLVSWQVGSVDEARAAEDAGCDVVVAQGVEAGGHVGGHTPLLALLAGVLDAVDVPVLGAGGIGHPRALAAVLAAGAAGARVGTVFVATVESGAHLLYKQAVVDAPLGATSITDAFAVCPLCATSPRARILNTCIEAVRALTADEAGEMVLRGNTVTIPKGSGIPPGESVTGHVGAMPMYASEVAGAVDAVEPAADVLGRLCEGAERLLAR